MKFEWLWKYKEGYKENIIICNHRRMNKAQIKVEIQQRTAAVRINLSE